MPPAERSLVTRLQDELRLPGAICQLLVARGQHDVDDAKRFLRPRLEQLHDPARLDGVTIAAERLARAARAGETVLVHGDYDVDGMCSTSLLVRVLRMHGARAVPFIPHRVTDGYDLTDAGVRAAREAGASVVVTCDCGTSALGPVAQLCADGADVIISDHHLPGRAHGLPDCFALLNPNLPDSDYPERDRGLAAVGVAFKLALAFVRALGASDAPVYKLLDLVALATIADMAPLRGENRVLARYGLRMLAESTLPGIRALVRAAGLDEKAMTAGRVSFTLAPRLNAVGRLGSALRGVELLLTDDEREANGIARELEELNRKRQEMDRAVLADALRQVDRLDLDETYGLVLHGEGWHPGVIGIVASHVVEQTGRPAILVAVDADGVGKGSGRSIPGFDLHLALSECDRHGLFQRFGGHKAAAGVTMAAAHLTDFAERFNDVARQKLTSDDLVPVLRYDLELSIDDANEQLEALLRHFEPFGLGNASPTFVSRGVTLVGSPKRVGEAGLRLKLATVTGPADAIGWSLADRGSMLADGARVDIAYRLERDEFRGQSRLQARLLDVALSGRAG